MNKFITGIWIEIRHLIKKNKKIRPTFKLLAFSYQILYENVPGQDSCRRSHTIPKLAGGNAAVYVKKINEERNLPRCINKKTFPTF